MKKEFDYLIVGAGLFGSVFAYQAQQAGKKCLVIDKRSHTGGNIYCENEDGINVQVYGAHIFHTDNEEAWKFVNRFVRFNHYVNSPLAYYKGQVYNLPFNMNTFSKLWGVVTPDEAKAKIKAQQEEFAHITEPQNMEEQALKLCGREIYEIFIEGYTRKQWGVAPSELPAFIIKRVPFRFVYNNNYFEDPYQGIPSGGYNRLTDALLENVEVRLEANYFEDRDYFDSLADKILFTGCIDEFFNYEYGKLDYRSLRFEHERLEKDDFQGNAVVNYNEYEIPFTRIIEHKHFEFGKQPHTVITREYPQDYTGDNEPYYPINTPENMKKLEQYNTKAHQLKNVIFGGRLAQYKYFDMDDTVIVALSLSKRELNIG